MHSLQPVDAQNQYNDEFAERMPAPPECMDAVPAMERSVPGNASIHSKRARVREPGTRSHPSSCGFHRRAPPSAWTGPAQCSFSAARPKSASVGIREAHPKTADSGIPRCWGSLRSPPAYAAGPSQHGTTRASWIPKGGRSHTSPCGIHRWSPRRRWIPPAGSVSGVRNAFRARHPAGRTVRAGLPPNRRWRRRGQLPKGRAHAG
jgi:hypothetical protein